MKLVGLLAAGFALLLRLSATAERVSCSQNS